MAKVVWDIRRKGRRWSGTESDVRWPVIPQKFEEADGKLFDTDEQRLNVLAMLLENVGVDRAVRLGNPEVWRGAIAALR